MNVRKLKNFAKFIASVPRKHFYMGSYSNHPQAHKRIPLEDKVVSKKTLEHTCGTTCCLAGWEVARRGFGLVDDDDVVKITKSGVEYVGKGAHQFAQDSLGLTDAEANKLFLEWDARSRTPKGAAKKILKFVEENRQ